MCYNQIAVSILYLLIENMSTVPAAVGATVGGFIGGVLLTAVIASCVAIVVSYRSKKKPTEHDPDSNVW